MLNLDKKFAENNFNYINSLRVNIKNRTFKKSRKQMRRLSCEIEEKKSSNKHRLIFKWLIYENLVIRCAALRNSLKCRRMEVNEKYSPPLHLASIQIIIFQWNCSRKKKKEDEESLLNGLPRFLPLSYAKK